MELSILLLSLGNIVIVGGNPTNRINLPFMLEKPHVHLT